MTRMTRFAVAFIAAAGTLTAARVVRAQDAGTNPDCTTLPNPIYMTGSSAFQPTVNAFAIKLAAETTPTTVIYKSSASCVGASAVASNTPLTGTGTYYTANGTQSMCTFPAPGPLPDVGVSDVFYASCGANAPQPQPSGLGDFLGPVQAMEFIVNKTNTLTAITAQEAQDVYGCGASGNILTFNQASGIFARNATSGTQIIISSAIGLDPTAVMGMDAGGSGTMITDVAGYSMPTAAIGFVGADVYDTKRTSVSALAFQAFGQTMAFYADSSSSAVDRKNVRDGHYFPWGYEHLLAKVDGSGVPSSAGAKAIIGLITGTQSDPTFDYVKVEGQAGTIPLCAMKVQKKNDSPGYLSSYAPADTCNCAFEAAYSGTAPAGCTACTAGADAGSTCTGGKSCHHGFCE